MDEKQLKIIATRCNIDYACRQEQIGINILGWKGGQPYIEARLSRFAGESKLDWEGGTRDLDGSKITGRKSQSHVVPHLSRIVEKINQYVLGTSPLRNGLSPEIENLITTDGKSINQLMKSVSSLVTVAKWCWIGIDVPASGNPISIEEKQSMGIRPFWRVYNPLEIVDWYFDGLGNLKWVLTQTNESVCQAYHYQSQEIMGAR
jgi:hypothetical protein